MEKQKRSKSVGLRVSEELWKKLEKAARQNQQSLNSEMVMRLARSFEEGKRMKEMMDNMQEMMTGLSRADDERIASLEAEVAALKKGRGR